MITKIKLQEKDLVLIQRDLEENKPYEACGVLVGDIFGNIAVVEKAIPVTSINRTRQSFELDSKEFYNIWNDACKNGSEVVGIYHTHPSSSAYPSLWDKETMENDMSVWLIAGSDEMRAYVWKDGIKPVKIIIN